MNLDDATNPVAADDTAEATVTDDTGVDTEDQSSTDEPQYDDDGNPITDQEPDEDEEVDVDEELKLKVPKSQAQKVREALLRQADYTRKTQEVADQRKALEAERVQFNQSSDAEINALATWASLNQQVSHYEKLDWGTLMGNAQARLQQALAAFDPDAQAQAQAEIAQIQSEQFRYTQIKDQRNQAAVQFQGLKQQRTLQAQQEFAKREEQGRQQLAKEIPGWNEETKTKLTAFARNELGFTPEEVSELEADPRQAKTLHWAMKGLEADRKAKKAANLAAGQKVTPAPTLRGTSRGAPIQATTNDFREFEKLADRKLASS